MYLRHFFVLIVFLLLAACSPVTEANDSTPVPSVAAATPLPVMQSALSDSLFNLTLVEEIGTGQFTQFVWSSDSSQLIGQATSGVWLFDNLDDLNASTGRLEGSVFVGAMTYSSDGRFFATSAGSNIYQDQPVTLYDANDGSLLFEFREAGVDDYMDIAFAPDGDTILALSNDGVLLEWATEDGSLIRTIDVDLNNLRHMAISPDGQWIAIGSSNNSTDDTPRETTWIVNYETEAINPLASQNGSITGMFFLNDNRLLITRNDSSLHIWNPETTAEPESSLTLSRTMSSPHLMDDGTVISGHVSDRIDLETGEISQAVDGRRMGRLSPDGAFAIGISTGSIKLFDVASQEEISIMETSSYTLDTVISMPDGLMLGNFPGGEALDIWDVETATIVASIESDVSTYSTYTASYDGSLIAGIPSFDDRIEIYDRETLELVYDLSIEGHQPAVIQFSDDGTRLLSYKISSEDDNSIYIWDMENGELYATLEQEYPIRSATFGVDNTQVIIGIFHADAQSITNQLILWDIESNEQQMTVSPDVAPARRITLAPDKSTLMVGGLNSLAGHVAYQFFDPTTLEAQSDALILDEAIVTAPVFNTESSLVINSLDRGSLYLWDVSAHQVIAQAPGKGGTWYYGIAFLSDDRILTTDSTGILNIWQFEDGE